MAKTGDALGQRPVSAPAAATGGAPVEADAAARAATALARLFLVAPLYPADHERSRSAADACLDALRDRGSIAAVQLEVVRAGFRVGGAPVALDASPLERLHRDLSALGIARLEIDAAATPEDLHRVATALLEARRRVGSTHAFRQLELDGLPGSIRVAQREFGRRTSDATSAASVRAAVEGVLEACEGSSEETQALVRSALERVFGSVVETLCEGRLARVAGQTFGRSLDDVLAIGAAALRSAMEDLVASGGDSTDLQGLFGAAEKALAVANDRESVEVMLSVLRKSSDELRHDAEPRIDGARYELSVEALGAALEAYGPDAPAFVPPGPVDRCEELSILLHLLLASAPGDDREKIEASLGACLARPLDGAETSFLGNTVRALAARGDSRVVDCVIPPLVRGLRQERAAGDFLVRISAAASPGELDALWPHLANELLVAEARLDPRVREDLEGRIGAADQGPREVRIERLLRLDAATSQRFAAEAFDPPPPVLFPVFEAFVARAIPGFAEALLAGFQRHPPSLPGAEAVLVFRDAGASCRSFLIALLRDGRVERASEPLEGVARRILATELAGLRGRDAAADWAPRAIVALGRIATPTERSLLREIRRGFRIWPPRRWPRPCREAARSALAPDRREHGSLE